MAGQHPDGQRHRADRARDDRLVPALRVATAFIDPGSPWQNGYSESFNGRFRDEFLTTEEFDTLLEAQVLAEDWRIEYNTYRPHGSLGDLTPEAFKEQWTETQPALS